MKIKASNWVFLCFIIAVSILIYSGGFFVTVGCTCEELCEGTIWITNNTAFEQEVRLYHQGELIHTQYVGAGRTEAVIVDQYTDDDHVTLSWEAWYDDPQLGRLFQDEGTVTYTCNTTADIVLQ